LSSAKLYRSIAANSRSSLLKNQAGLDKLAKNPADDSRRGISLILPVRLNGEAYGVLVDALSRIEPGQYFYPIGDLHVTIFDFVKAKDGFLVDMASEANFLDIARRACAETTAFELRFTGIVCSAEASLIAGYDGDALIDLRGRIRRALEAAEISNDERYRSLSSHATFMRFSEKFRSTKRFLVATDSYALRDFGSMQVHFAELVEHDWYNRAISRRVLGSCEFRQR